MKLLRPFQKCTHKDVSLVTYSFRVEAKSSDSLPFITKASFKIFPSINYKVAFNDLERIIKGEICIVAASMTMNEIFKNSKVFKVNILDKVQLQLNQFGLMIYDAIFEQVVDNAHKNLTGNSALASNVALSKNNKVSLVFDLAPCPVFVYHSSGILSLQVV